MFNIITNVKNRTVIDNITLDDFINQMKNPSVIHKKIVDKARDLGKGTSEYESIKKSLPCFVPNYTHNSYVKVDTISKSTGFIYIDVDYELSLDFSKFSFIAASWKSLSGVGSGILVALDDTVDIGTDLKTMRAIINDICSTLDVKPDSCAVSRDRLNVIGYDYDVYYNENYSKYEVNNLVNISTDKVDKKENKKLSIRLARNVHFYDGDLRLTNLDDFTKDFTFKDDELYIDMSDTPIEYTEVYIPKSISTGDRNSRLYKILSTVRSLNPMLSKERLIGFAKHINNTKCYEPLDESELISMCIRISELPPNSFSNKTKKYVFNPIYTLTGIERRSVAASESRKKIGRKTTEKLLDYVKDWDEKIDGKFTLKALSEKSNVSYKTVLRRKKDINNLRN
jgi:hypothetical protein